MKQDDILTLDIVDQGVGGEGIAKMQDYVIFVPYALAGERVEARVTHVKRNLVYTKLRRVLVPSLHRVQPACAAFGSCGGCDLMHADYDYQLEVKQQNVATTLSKAKVEANVDPVCPSSSPLGYRNKIMLPFGLSKGEVVVGFYRPNTHTVVPISACPLHAEWASKLIDVTLQFVRKYKLSVYCEATGKGLLRHLVARYLQGNLDVTIVATGDLPRHTEYAKMLTASFPNVALYLSRNTHNNNVIMGDNVTLLYGKPAKLSIDGVSVAVNPLSFLQVNDAIRDAIYQRVADMVRAGEGCTVVDAFAGVGVLGATMAQKGATVYNIEIVPEAVRDADRLAKENGLGKVHNLLGDSALQLPSLLEYLSQSAPAVHSMKLRAPYWQAIREGRKTYELRQNDAKRKSIQQGDLVAFTCLGGEDDGAVLYALVTSKQQFATFADLFVALGTQNSCAESCSVQDAVKGMQSIYPVACPDGVVAIGVCPINVRGLSILLDPPRKGCPEAVVQSLVTMAQRYSDRTLEASRSVAVAGETLTLPFVEQLVYISCNPATLARDLAMLQSAYRVETVTPYDMFPQTKHVETLVCLKRRVDR